MQGLMMDYPLTLTHPLERAAKLYPQKEIAAQVQGTMRRSTYADIFRRVHRLAFALDALGVKRGERVATLCWNSDRHLEAYFAVPCSGRVLHTLNCRLSADQLVYIVNHAEDRVIFVDASLAPMIAALQDRIGTVRQYVVLDEPGTCHGLSGAACYEELLAASPAHSYSWPNLDENTAAAMCYTSGTTGNPKGVVYSHRALMLHSFALCMADCLALSERDSVLQVVPMFHCNGWGTPFAGVMTGARLIFPGRNLSPENLAHLIESERITFTSGVPTIWIGLKGYLENHTADISSLRTIVCAGSALPRCYVEWYAKHHGIPIQLLWGMTETTPVATFMAMKSHLDGEPETERFDRMARHGMAVPGVDLRIIDTEGKHVPWDGITMGELQVRGPWITSGYYNDSRSEQAFMDGWFRTGDVATIDSEGYIQITDRSKDVIKSGGEWISSVDLENAIMAHPKVAEAAVIGIFHPQWQERPLACVAVRPDFNGSVTKQEILDFLRPHVAKWWLPDEIVFVSEIPKTSVGKFNKRALREQFKDFQLADCPDIH